MSGAYRDEIDLFINGRAVSVPRGTSVLVAVALAGLDVTRVSVTGQARGPLCGMGICHECRVTIDGRAHQRACMIESVPGMKILAGGDA